MTVLATYATARAWFSPAFAVTGAANNGAGAIRLTIPGHPYVTGNTVNVEGVQGTTEANGLWTITEISSSMIDLTGSTSTHAYTSGGSTQLLAFDGLPAWPGPLQSDGSYDNSGSLALNRLRTGGFGSSWTCTSNGGHVWSPANCGILGPLIASAVPGGDALFPFTISVNAGATGGAYAWWLSQRGEPVRYPSTAYPTTITPTGAPQLLTCTHPDNAHPGTVVIGVNAGEVTKLFPGSGGVPPTDAASLAKVFKNVAIYCSRRSDFAFQWARLVAATQ